MELQQEVDFPSDYPEPNNIIIDCDVGGDGAQTLLLAFHLAKKYQKKIVAIMCCEGNTSILNVVKNVLICKGLLIQYDK
jgi:inosine-uridine nucleoside N-ribohydrolase